MQYFIIKKVALIGLLFIPHQTTTPFLGDIPGKILNKLRNIYSPHTQDILCDACSLPLYTKSARLADMPFKLQCNHSLHTECAYSSVYSHRSHPDVFPAATCLTSECKRTISKQDQNDLKFLYSGITQYPRDTLAPVVSRALDQRREQVQYLQGKNILLERKNRQLQCALIGSVVAVSATALGYWYYNK